MYIHVYTVRMEKWIFYHIFGLFAAVHIYRSSSILNILSVNDSNVTSRVIDYLPNLLIQLDIGEALSILSLAIVFLYVVYLLYKLYQAVFGKTFIIFKQVDRDVGYVITPGRTKRDIANMVRRRKRIGDIPPPYPNGWYEIMRSEDLPVGGAKAVSLIGQHFAVFRRENGQVSIMDAYCPHLGANLGVGGQVRGNCIECPFHGWQFDGETGQCTSIPYASKVPSFAKTKVWPSLEINGFIFIWYDVEGREPHFYLDEMPEIKKGKWAYKGCTVHYVNCHIEDIPENGADIAHLKTVHETGVQAGSKVDYNLSTWIGRILTHHWKVNWEALPPPQAHIGRMTLSMNIKLFGKWNIKPFDFHVVVDQIGPAVVYLRFKLLFGNGAFLQTIVPEEPVMQRLTHYIYCDWWIPTFLATWILLSGDAIQIERDAIVWGNKTYVSKPVLVKEDNLIVAHRRWYSQFYSENSTRLSFKKEDEAAW